MNKILLSFLFSCVVVCGHSQTYWKLDPQNEWTGTDPAWNAMGQSNGTISAGNFVQSNLIKSDGSASKVSFVGISGFRNNSSTAMQGNGKGVFSDLIENHGWYFSNNARFKFTGLDNSKYYSIYVLVTSWHYEGGTVSFNVGHSTSNTVSTSLNVGDREVFANWETDPALNSLINIAPKGGEIEVTFNLSGYGAIEAIVLKEQSSFWVPTNPAAPRNAVVDDKANTFDFTYNPAYKLPTQYDYTLDSGYTWHSLRTKPLIINNVSIKKGFVGVRVKDLNGNGAGYPLWNNTAFTITSSQPSPSIITIKVVMNGKPNYKTELIPAGLKYNKWGRFGITNDDRQLTALDLAAYITGGTAPSNKVTYPGKFFTDGANVNSHEIKWTGSVATNAYLNADSLVYASHDPSSMNWSQVNSLIQEGWSLLDHGAWHGTEVAGAKNLGFNTLMNAAQNRNYTFRKLRALGTQYVMRFGVVPTSDPNYHSAWEQLGYIGGSSEGTDDGYPGSVPGWQNHGLVDVTEWAKDRRYKVHLRHFSDLTNQKQFTHTEAWFDAALPLSASSNATRHYSAEVGLHNSIPDTIKRVIDEIAEQFGDHIWVCGLQEFYEYFETIQQTKIKQKIAGDTLLVTLDQTYLNSEQRWRDMSFLLNSNVGIKSVSVSGADDYSYNTSTGLINIYKKKTKGFEVPADAWSTGFAFSSKIPFTKDQVFIDNHFDYRAAALIDGDIVTPYNTAGGMLYSPYDVTFNLSDFGAVVDSVRVRVPAGGDSYTTKVILTRNDNEAEDSIGLFTNQTKSRWLTFRLKDTSRKYVASRVILRSNSKGGFGTEVQVYGDYLPYMGQTFKHIQTPLKYQVGTNGHWWNWENNSDGSDNENAFRAVDSMQLYSIRNYGDANDYQDSTGDAWYFNPVRQGWNEDQMWRHFKRINPEVIRFSVMNGQSIAVQNMWNTPDSSWRLEGVVTNVTEHGAYSIIHWNATNILSGAQGSGVPRIRIIKKGSSNSTGHNSDDSYTLTTGVHQFGTDPNAGFKAGDTIIVYNRFKSLLNLPYPQSTTIAGRNVAGLYDTAARFGYVWSARHGRNGKAHFIPARGNNDSVGLNTAEWIEVMNEPTASWLGFNDYLNGNHLGLAWSKVYDNNKAASTTLGVKNADTSMVMSTSGLAVSDPDVMYGAEYWARKNRGGRPKEYVPTQPMTWKARTWGWTDNPYDIIQFHNYAYTGGSNQWAGNVQSGLPIELSHALEAVDGFVLFKDKYAPTAKMDVGEWGYDIAQRSPMNAPPIDSYTAEEVRGAWALRTMLVNNVHGIDYSQWYRFAQDAPNGDTSNGIQFATMSLIRWNNSNDISLTSVGRQFGQFNEFGDYVYDSTLREDSIYCYRFKKGTNYLYTLWSVERSPNMDNWKNEKALFHERAGLYKLPLKKASEVIIRKPQTKGNRMSRETKIVSAGGLGIQYGLIPTFIEVLK